MASAWEESNRQDFLRGLRSDAERHYRENPKSSKDEFIAYSAFMSAQLTSGETYEVSLGRWNENRALRESWLGVVETL